MIPSVALTILVLGAVPVLAEPYTIGDIRFDLPEKARGWELTQGEGGSMMLRKTVDNGDGGKGGGFIQVTAPTKQGAFPDNFATMSGILPELRDEDPIIERTGVTMDQYPAMLRDVCCGYRDDMLLASITVGMQRPDAQYFLMLVTINLDSDERQALEEEFAFAVRSVRGKDDDKLASFAPPQGTGGLDGVYTSLQTNLMPNVFGGLDYTSESVILAFDPSGLYSREIPAAGVSMQDHCAAVPKGCGSYALRGGGWFGGAKSIEMAELDNDYGILATETVDFSQDGDDLSIDQDDYHRIPPLPRGTSLDGTWRYFWASSGMTATSSGGVSSERLLTMGPDGRFEMTGWSGVMSSNTVGDNTTSVSGSNDRPNMSGRYEVDGYTLTLIGTDGNTKKLSLFQPDVGSDELLVIDGNNYLKNDD